MATVAALWRGRFESRARRAELRRRLVDALAESVRAVQYAVNEARDDARLPFVDGEAPSALCEALEAALLHGAKHTLLSKARSALAGDADRSPEPSFWPLLLVLSHRDIVERVASLNNISTDVGHCRAWIRVALNDGLTSSYLATAAHDTAAAAPYYERGAFVRDADSLEVAQWLMKGVESCTRFELATNSTLLNRWTEDVLTAAGVRAPSSRCSVSIGTDVASCLRDDPQPTIAAPRAYDRDLPVDRDKLVAIILSNTPENFAAERLSDGSEKFAVDEPSDTDERASPAEERAPSPSTDDDSESDVLIEYESCTRPEPIGNRIIGNTAWSTLEIELPFAVDSSGPVPEDSVGASPINASRDDRPPHVTAAATTKSCSDDPLLASLGFEVVSESASTAFDSTEFEAMLPHVETIAREYGLDLQEYQCSGCKQTIGTSASKSNVCTFTGKYFCTLCMHPDVFLMPAYFIHNWDFKRYPVCRRAGLFLLEFQHRPLVNMKKINPSIYSYVRQMAQLQTLRMQLNFLRAYLFTCREPVIEELQKRVWPREYLYEHVHTYSVSDLNQIANGSLASQLQKIVNFARNHVKDCWLCSQKGFICEICTDPKILYPFNLDNTSRCDNCSTVFHAKCFNSLKPCPKCKRKEIRHEKSLIDAIHNNLHCV